MKFLYFRCVRVRKESLDVSEGYPLYDTDTKHIFLIKMNHFLCFSCNGGERGFLYVSERCLPILSASKHQLQPQAVRIPCSEDHWVRHNLEFILTIISNGNVYSDLKNHQFLQQKIHLIFCFKFETVVHCGYPSICQIHLISFKEFLLSFVKNNNFVLTVIYSDSLSF